MATVDVLDLDCKSFNTPGDLTPVPALEDALKARELANPHTTVKVEEGPEALDDSDSDSDVASVDSIIVDGLEEIGDEVLLRGGK